MAGNGYIKVTWGQSERANHYAIKRRIVGSETQYWDQKTQPASEARLFIDRNVLNGKSYQYQVVAINESGDSEPATTAQVTPASQVQPDGMVRTEAEGALAMSRGAQGRALPGSLWDGYSGNDIYNTVGTKQERSLSVLRNGAAVYQVRVQNDGKVNDIIKVTAPASGGGWVIRYRDIILGTDITDAITNQDVLSGGYRLGLKPGAYRDLSITVTPSGIVPIGTVKEVALTLVSTNNAKRLDVVRTLTTVISTEAQIVVHPQASDFKPGMAGRIMVSALQDAPADKYYTTAQTADGKVTITANLSVPGQPASAAANKRVYFRVLDPDDASSYEMDPAGNDNFPAGYKGVLSAQSEVSTVTTVNGQQVAVAKVDLAFNEVSGNNYQVEASLNPNFPTNQTSRSVVMVAWKRVYFEMRPMYKQGTTVVNNFPSGPNQPNDGVADVLPVDSIEGLTARNEQNNSPGTTVVLFTPDGVKQEKEILATDAAAKTITVADLNFSFIAYKCGVKVKDNNDTYQAPADLLPQAFGRNTDGSDGGAFVEFENITREDAVVPRMTELRSLSTLENFGSRWKAEQPNVVQIYACRALRGLGGSLISGISKDGYNIIAIPVEVGTGGPVWIRKTAVHEMGHQWDLTSAHEDGREFYVKDHAQQPYCIMTYDEDFNDEKHVEFDIQCLNDIRRANDPL